MDVKDSGAAMSDLCPGSWVEAAARQPRGRSWGRWRHCKSGWWRRCRRAAAACLAGWWSPAGRACRGGRGWRSGRSSEASGSGPSWWDWAAEQHTRDEINGVTWNRASELLHDNYKYSVSAPYRPGRHRSRPSPPVWGSTRTPHGCEGWTSPLQPARADTNRAASQPHQHDKLKFNTSSLISWILTSS